MTGQRDKSRILCKKLVAELEVKEISKILARSKTSGFNYTFVKASNMLDAL